MAEPLPICFLNGEFLPLSDARVSPLDRGFLYADAAYEVMPVYGGRPFRFEAHCARLTRSLGELRMQDPHERAEWRRILGALIERNGGGEQYVYWQVTRGAERGRNPAPLPDLPRTVYEIERKLPFALKRSVARLGSKSGACRMMIASMLARSVSLARPTTLIG